MTITYEYEGALYVNLTNKCNCNCEFCLRHGKAQGSIYTEDSLWLEREPTRQEALDSFLGRDVCAYREIVFCGYGEPMMKLDVLKEVAKYIKNNYPESKIRVNTNGHANFVYKRNVVPELKGLIDEFSVSLNGATKEEYNELSQPKFDEAYEEMKKFIKSCADENISVVASVVEGYKGRHLDLEKCEQIANDLGAKFRVREWIVNGY